MKLQTVPAAVAAGVAAAGCAMALAACGTVSSSTASASAGGSTGTASTAPSAAAATCGASQLRVTLTNTGALGGQAGGYLQFTNDGAAPCQLTGFPVVSGVTAGGQVTSLKDAQSTMFGAWVEPSALPVLTLAPSQSGYAVVAADDHPAGSASCGSPYTQLRVTPPGSSGSVVVSGWLPGADSYLPACPAANGSSTAEVSAVTPLSGLAG